MAVTEMRLALTNSGTVAVQSGTLDLTGGSTSTGAWTESSGATLNFDTGTHDLNSGSSVGGTGRVLVVAPAAVNVNTGCTYNTLGTTELASGFLSLGSGVSATAATFNQSGGTLGGSGALNVPGTLNWSGGEQSGGGTTTATAVMTVSGSATKTLSGARTLVNSGTATWTQTSSGYLQVGEGSVINNTGTWDSQSDAILWNGNLTGSSTFLNSGTFKKSGGAAITEVRVNLTNSGTVSVQSGTMQLTVGSTSSGGFTGATGATLQFGTGTHTLNAGSSIGGLERVLVSAPAAVTVNAGSTYNVLGSTELQSGSLYFGSGVSAVSATFNQSGGALGGPGLLSVPGVLNWTGGDQLGGGTTTASGVLTISGSTAKTLHGARVLANTATATWTQTGAGYLQVGEGSVINNTGTWNAQSDAILWNANMAGSSTFVNAGTFKKVGGGSVTEVRIPLINSGTVGSQTGTLSFTSTSTPNGYVQTAGLTQATGGILLSTNPFSIQHGTLGGTGTITGSVLNGGTLSPGNSPAILGVTGSYIQSSGGTYNVELGGTGAGSQYDQVNFTGTVTLAGTLHVSLIDNYIPNAGDAFTIMTFASRSGSFNATELPTLGAGLDWCISYGLSSLVLAVVGTDPEADCDLDGVPNGLDCGPNDPSAFAVPSEITGVGFLANKTTMLWGSAAASAGSGTRYDVARGLLNELPVGPAQGDASEVCEAPTVPNASMADLSIPASRQGFWYLVRGHNDCGSGPYGHRSNGQDRITSICP